MMRSLRTFLLLACSLLAWIAASITATTSIAEGQDPQDRLVGSWQAKLAIHNAKLDRIAGDQELDAASIAALRTQLQNASMTLKLNADGTSFLDTEGYPGNPDPKIGTWQVVSVEETHRLVWQRRSILTGHWIRQPATMMILKGKSGDNDESEITLYLDGDDRFTMTSPQLSESPFQSPVFRRVNSP